MVERSLESLTQELREFAVERDWEQFHSPKNLAMALTVEAAELMEHFQWITPEASRAIRDRPEKLAEVGEELADVICYALAIANELGLDVSDTLRDKMQKNERKYPAAQYRGRYGPEDDGT